MHAGSKWSFRASRKMKSDNSKIRTTIYGSRGLVEARSITHSDSVTNASSAFFLFFFSFCGFFRVQCFSFSPSFLFPRYSSFMVTDNCIVINHISTVFCFHDRAGAGPHLAAESSARSRSFSLDVVPSTRRVASPDGRRTSDAFAPWDSWRELSVGVRNNSKAAYETDNSLKDLGQRDGS